MAGIRQAYEQEGLTPEVARRFRRVLCGHYRSQGRDLPWRRTGDPYAILISEFMLQQTRVETVKEYYLPFLQRFPDFASLASAPFPEVLRAWKGLGYNRRARALHETAKRVIREYEGVLPSDDRVLQSFPGIGKTTAAAIRAFAFHQPVVLLETNIRTVFLYFFFRQPEQMTDREILPLVEKTIPPKGVREWYYALMDFGVLLKREVGTLTAICEATVPSPASRVRIGSCGEKFYPCS
jgi:A/G-specific DNA glycosylase